MPGMFDNYEHLTDTKPEIHFPQDNDFSSDCPFRTEDGYEWHYGNTLNLEFIVEHEAIYKGNHKFVPAEDFMKGLKPSAKISLYNFRRECIHELILNNVDTTTIILPIDEELSKKLVPGVYYCSLVLYDEVTGFKEMVFSTNDCTLTVI